MLMGNVRMPINAINNGHTADYLSFVSESSCTVEQTRHHFVGDRQLVGRYVTTATDHDRVRSC